MVGLPYMRAHCKTGVVASKITGIAHVPVEFKALFEPGGRARFRARLACGSWTTNGIVLPSMEAAAAACAVCKDTLKGACVYRCFNAAGELLYIGSTGVFLSRLKQHASGTTWWDQVADVQDERFPTLPEARAAELAAISAEKPLRNWVHGNWKAAGRAARQGEAA